MGVRVGYADEAVSGEAQILSHENSTKREILERTLLMLNHKAKEIKESQERITTLLHHAPNTSRHTKKEGGVLQ
jgi:hypothetical protein